MHCDTWEITIKLGIPQLLHELLYGNPQKSKFLELVYKLDLLARHKPSPVEEGQVQKFKKTENIKYTPLFKCGLCGYFVRGRCMNSLYFEDDPNGIKVDENEEVCSLYKFKR